MKKNALVTPGLVLERVKILFIFYSQHLIYYQNSEDKYSIDIANYKNIYIYLFQNFINLHTMKSLKYFHHLILFDTVDSITDTNA